MGQQKGMSFKEFRQRFQTEEVCKAHLFEQRWPDGFAFPRVVVAGFTDGVSMSVPTLNHSVNRAATYPFFADGVVLGNLP